MAKPQYFGIEPGNATLQRVLRSQGRADLERRIARTPRLAPAPADDDGLDRKRLESLIAVMKKVGGIQPGKEPVKYERLVDQSVWRDAKAMTK